MALKVTDTGLTVDQKAYDECLDRLQKDLKCFFAGRGCAAAADLAAEAVARLIRKREPGQALTGDWQDSLRALSFGIAKRVHLEWLRRPEALECALHGKDYPHPALSPDAQMITEACRRLLAEVIEDNLSHLTPADQDIIRRIELNPDYVQTLAELAKDVGKTAPSVRQAICRAKQRLRKEVLSDHRLNALLHCFGWEPRDL